jgi:dTDP-glucose pyrophosphorylase
MKRNRKALSKVIGPDVTVDGSENMFTYQEQKSGICNNIKLVNNFFENVATFKYLGEKTLQNQNVVKKKLRPNSIQKMATRNF